MSPSARVQDLDALASALAAHHPRSVCYIATGGQALGLALAHRLGLPAIGLDIGYPLSRPLERLPRWMAAALWPIKEVSYKFSTPRPRSDLDLLSPQAPVVLVDDSASSGKTLARALALLVENEIPANNVIRVVGRCGRRARGLVDYFLKE